VKLWLEAFPPGGKHVFHGEVQGDPSWLEATEGAFVGRLEVEGTLEDAPGELLLSGAVRLNVRGPCSLCLEPFERAYEFPFAETVQKGGAPRADEDVVAYSPKVLDLRPLLAQTVLLGLPIAPVCRADCAGLCAVCGRNLNLGPCGCGRDEVDPRLEKLKRLLAPPPD
jgi:uncharacterized protein